MPVTLRPIPAARVPEWLRRSVDEFANDLIALGHSRVEAHRVAAQGMAESFPHGRANPGHAIFDVVDETDAVVGYLWIGPSNGGDIDAWWLWDIVINEDQRRRGLGRTTMLLAEEYARSQGACSLGLSVFGFNTGARRLYESLGYETTTVKMSKSLRS